MFAFDSLGLGGLGAFGFGVSAAAFITQGVLRVQGLGPSGPEASGHLATARV